MFSPLATRLAILVVAAAGVCSCRRESAPTAADLSKARVISEKASRNNQEWYEKHFIKGYLEASGHDSRWDAAITNVLGLVASLRSGQGTLAETGDRIATVATGAIAEGCKDPFVRYLTLRYGPAVEDEVGSRGRALAETANDLLNQGYPPDMAFYACFRAAQALQGKKTEVTPEIYQMRQNALGCVLNVLGDKSYPVTEVQAECTEVLALLKKNPQMYQQGWDQMEPLLFKNWSQAPFPSLLKAEYHYNKGWAARGTGLADSVGQDAWKVFGKELEVAEESFRKAWQIDNTNPETARWMIEICVCQSHPRVEMEKWFQRAMAADPSYYPACKTKLRYLEPKWGGSPEAMIAFGHECLTNTAYRGDTITTLVDAYSILAGYYNKDAEKLAQFYAWPQLWQDVQAVYAKVAERDPDATWYHNNLAWYAWHCGQWEALERELAAIKQPNYNYFGGEARFNKMVEDSKAHSKHRE